MSYVQLLLGFAREKGLTTLLNYVVILSSLTFDGRFVFLREMDIA